MLDISVADNRIASVIELSRREHAAIGHVDGYPYHREQFVVYEQYLAQRVISRLAIIETSMSLLSAS